MLVNMKITKLLNHAPLIGILLLAGCTSQSLELSGKKLKPNTMVSYTAVAGHTINMAKSGNIHTCTTPAPDAAINTAKESDTSLSLSLVQTGGTPEKDDSEKSSATTEVEMSGRTPSVLLARELFFRLCEFDYNQNLSEKDAVDLYSQTLSIIEKNWAIEASQTQIQISEEETESNSRSETDSKSRTTTETLSPSDSDDQANVEVFPESRLQPASVVSLQPDRLKIPQKETYRENSENTGFVAGPLLIKKSSQKASTLQTNVARDAKYWISIASFKNRDSADLTRVNAQQLTNEQFFVLGKSTSKGYFFRVTTGPFSTHLLAAAAQQEFVAAGLNASWIWWSTNGANVKKNPPFSTI